MDVPDPVIPEAGEHIWQWFFQLSSGRGSNGFGLDPIAYGDIESWTRLTGADPSPDEVKVLKAMDGAMMEAVGEK